MQLFKTLNTHLQKKTKILSSIFLSIVLFALISQIYVTNDLPTLANILHKTNISYKDKLQQLEIKQLEIKKKLLAVVRNKEGIESSARYQLGFIKEGEKYYNFPVE